MTPRIDSRLEPPVAPLLIAASGRLALTALTSRTYRHALYIESRLNLLEAITSPAGHRFVALIGDPRCGKTHLLSDIIGEIHTMFRGQEPLDLNFRPVIVFKAPAPTRNEVRWDEVARLGLFELHAPVPELAVPPSRLEHESPEQYRAYGKSPEEYLELFCALARHVYKVQLIVIDEADHLTAAARGRDPINQLNVLKDLAVRSGARIVLCGTYQLLELIRASEQIEGRTRPVELPRYDYSIERHRERWAAVAAEMVGTIENANVELDAARLEDWHKTTRGRVGRLYEWLANAESRYLARQAPDRPFVDYLEDVRTRVARERDDLAVSRAPDATRTRRRPTTASGQVMRIGESSPKVRPLGNPYPVG